MAKGLTSCPQNTIWFLIQRHYVTSYLKEVHLHFSLSTPTPIPINLLHTRTMWVKCPITSKFKPSGCNNKRVTHPRANIQLNWTKVKGKACSLYSCHLKPTHLNQWVSVMRLVETNNAWTSWTKWFLQHKDPGSVSALVKTVLKKNWKQTVQTIKV